MHNVKPSGSEINLSELITACVRQVPVSTSRKLVLAYSGGVDSEVLARGLSDYKLKNPETKVLLVHVHHNLSPNADTWAAHCEQQAAIYQLPIVVKRVKVKTGARLSLEAQARDVRYQALLSTMDSGDVLLTAHHQDDQLETLLLALKRGLGPKGLSAMGAVQTIDKRSFDANAESLDSHFDIAESTPKQASKPLWLMRPLLDLTKDQIVEHAAKLGLQHIEDESNGDAQFDRNFLRLDIIPKLKQRWSSIAATASRSAALCAQQQQALEEELQLKLPQVQVDTADGLLLNIEALTTYSAAWQSLLLRAHIESLDFAPPSQMQTQQILSQLTQAKADAKVEIRIGTLLIRRYKQLGYFTTVTKHLAVKTGPQLTNQLTNITLEELTSTGVELNQAKRLYAKLSCANHCVRPPQIDESVSVRFALPGSTRCHPHHRSKGRELKKLWQELKVPTWERAQVPMVFYNEQLVAVVGYWVEKSFLAAKNSQGLSFELN